MARDLLETIFDLLPELRYAACAKRIRAARGGRPVVDTTGAVLVWEPRRIVPEYAVPEADLLVDLVPTSAADRPDPLPPVLAPGHFGWHTTPGTPLALGDEPSGREVAFRPDDPVLGGRVDLMSDSATHTVCAYKGRASYLSADVEGGQDIAWSYPDPLHDAEPVRDLVCFWSERCEVLVDGQPVTGGMPGE